MSGQWTGQNQQPNFRQPYSSGEQWAEDQQVAMDPQAYAVYQQQMQQQAQHSALYNHHMSGEAPPQFSDQPYSGYDNYGNMPPPSAPLTGAHPSEYTDEKESVSVNDDWKQRAAAPKRGQTKKVKLVRGHYIVNLPAPAAIRNSVEPKWTPPLDHNGRSEITHMRYSAVTCDADMFTQAEGWSLRQVDYGRQTELYIAITSYNEDKILLTRTLHSVFTNIRDIAKSDSKFWKGRVQDGVRVPAWQKCVVSIVMDGIDPCDKRALDVLAVLGVFQDNTMKREVDGKPVLAHLFEYTTQLSLDPGDSERPRLVEPNRSGGREEKQNLVPIQLNLLIKQHNAKKINSHRWVFNAFSRQLNPEVVILIDAGTKPGPRALYWLWNAFHSDRHLGGACGEVFAQTNGGWKLFNPLVAAQHFEYKMSNILDKSLESSFGFVTVLPGAFSAYRYRAVMGRPLVQYFQGERKLGSMNIFHKNMFLAEDRILCFELMAKAGCKWHLSYVPQAKGETDVPEGVAELISQRRRWLNGSFAASIYSLVHFFRVYRSSHNILRLLFFHVQAIYTLLVLVFTWFNLSSLWLTFSIITTLLPEEPTNIYIFYNRDITLWVNKGCQWLYLAALTWSFVLALGNRPKGERFSYLMLFIINAVMGFYLLASAILLTVRALTNTEWVTDEDPWENLKNIAFGDSGILVAALISTFGIYVLGSLMYFQVTHLITSFPPYLLMAASWVNVLNVYAFCNLHDVSWGTKGSDKADALPSVVSKKNVIENVEKDDSELMDDFRRTAIRALAPHRPPPESKAVSEDDSNRTFRTRLVLFWMLCNAVISVGIGHIAGLNPDEETLRTRQSMYFQFILVATFFITLVKFLGSFYFWVINIISLRWCRRS